MDPTAAVHASPAGNIPARCNAVLVLFSMAAGEAVRFTAMHKPDGLGAWTAESEHSIAISGIDPVPPGLSSDDRRSAIGLSSIRIGPQ